MAKLAKVTLTLEMDDDPPYLEQIMREAGVEPDITHNANIARAVEYAMANDAMAFLQEFDNAMDPITVDVIDR